MVDDADAARERALDELYGTDPDEFVATRKRLATELRSAGHRDAAAVVAKARRPTKAAASLNAVARTDPEGVARFLDASAAVRAAQSGGGGDVRATIRAQREALDALAAAALGPDPSEARRAEVMTVLQAAGLDEHVAALLRAGRLVRAEEAEVDFTDLLAGAPGLPAPPPRPPKERPKSRRATPPAKPSAPAPAADEAAPAKATDADADRERAEAERIAAKARAARDEADAAQEAAAAAAREADELEATVGRLEDELRAARDAARTARRAATAARRAAEAATARAERWARD